MSILFNFKETGVLKLDKIFFESYYPILFTCKNDKNDLFLCVCCTADTNIRKWLVTDTTPETVINLLSNKITIRDSFLKNSGSRYTIIYNLKNEKYLIEVDNVKDWDEKESIYLPTAGEYMDPDNDEFLEEINYYKNNEIKYENYEIEETIEISKEKIIYDKNGTFSIIDRYINNLGIDNSATKLVDAA